MSKYKVGDKFVIEIEEVYNGDLCKHEDHMHLYRIKDFNSLVLDEYGLGKLVSVKAHDTIEAFNNVTGKNYEQGFNDALELIKKLWYESNKILGYENLNQVLKDFAPQEALAKLKAYEEAQSKIEVGDVVSNDKEQIKGIVLDFDNADPCAWVFTENECVEEWDMCDIKKTGTHIGIESLINRIREV